MEQPSDHGFGALFSTIDKQRKLLVEMIRYARENNYKWMDYREEEIEALDGTITKITVARYWSDKACTQLLDEHIIGSDDNE